MLVLFLAGLLMLVNVRTSGNTLFIDCYSRYIRIASIADGKRPDIRAFTFISLSYISDGFSVMIPKLKK